jgi:SAM-dependent methyltransferase
MTGTDDYIKKLLESYPLRERLLRSAVRELRPGKGSLGLDAGCGIGQPALLLAEEIGPGGHVTGLDLSAPFLRHAEDLAKRAGFSDRITFERGDVSELPFNDNAFDWAWSVDCVGYPAGDLVSSLRELARVVRPGGTVAILAWSSQCLLPGYTLLEARLNASCSGLAPYVTGAPPESQFLRALGAFGEAGLKKAQGKTFIGDVQAPLSDDIRTALHSFFDMLWGKRQLGVSVEDWDDYQRLCSPESPDCILNLPDYYAFFTYSMFRGKVAK